MYMYRNACIVIGWKGIHLLRVSFRKFAKGANSKETKHLGGGAMRKLHVYIHVWELLTC